MLELFLPEHSVYALHDQIRGLSSDRQPRVCKIDSLFQILEDPILRCSHNPIDVWSDFDGVVNHLFKNDSDPYKWFALRRIVEHARNFYFFSMRFYTSMDLHIIPFFSKRLQERIKNVMNRSNPECNVEFYLGFDKIFDQRVFESLSSQVHDALDEGVPVFFIGSSVFDRLRWMRIVGFLLDNAKTDLSLLRYYDTGRIFI
ncbi:MAG: hypothetical protein N3A54_01800 [Patescibacteria group bacterium]|nr:hypothetical protein [Patescibacteria group bacterium]